MFIAKPNLNNTMGTAEFPTEKEAIEYLEKYTGIEMDFEVVRRKDKTTGKTKVISRTSDWYLLGKLTKTNG
jgi:hypothetical protein